VGWIGYDPMLGEATSGQHIVVGISNHPRAIMPVSGTFFDEHDSYRGMEVAVQTARFEELETPRRIFGRGQSKPTVRQN
jgi:hypothetical protein